MANWYGHSRSNYFKLKVAPAFKDWAKALDLEVWRQGGDLFAMAGAWRSTSMRSTAGSGGSSAFSRRWRLIDHSLSIDAAVGVWADRPCSLRLVRAWLSRRFAVSLRIVLAWWRWGWAGLL